MLKKAKSFINKNFIPMSNIFCHLKKSKDFYSISWSFMDTVPVFPFQIYRPPFKLRVRRALEYPSFFLYYTILYYTYTYPLVDSRIYVSQDGGRSILSLKFSIPSFSPSIPTIFLRFLEWVGTKKRTKTERFCFRNPRFIDIWGN